MTGWRRMFESYLGDLDELLPYTTPRTLKIRDCRLGVALLLAQLAILGYVLGYQIIYNQQYQVAGDVIATSRMQLQRPDAAYRWPDGAAPYCTGGTGVPASGGPTPYRVNATAGTYAYTGPGGVDSPQAPCLYLDELYAVPNSLERDAVMLTTRLTTTEEAAVPSPDCNGQGHTYCSWVNTTGELDWYIADSEMFTLLVDHSMYAPDAGITRTVRQMKGRMRVRPPVDPTSVQSRQDRDASAPYINPCDAYTSLNLPCPPYINVGSIGDADIFPIKTLLQAAGIANLDLASGYDGTETLRHAGIVLVLEVEYSNYLRDTGSWAGGDVVYTYWVTAVPSSEFKAESASAHGPNATNPAPATRTVYNRHGVRVVLSFSGRIGSFNLQAFFINLFVSLGLLGAASALLEAIVFYLPLPATVTSTAASVCCGRGGGSTFLALRRVYRQYKERETIDFGDLLRTQKMDAKALEALLARFASEPDLVDPTPEVFRPIIALYQQEQAALQGKSVPASPIPYTSNSSSANLLQPQVSYASVGTTTAFNPLAASATAGVSNTVSVAGGPAAGPGASTGAVAEWQPVGSSPAALGSAAQRRANVVAAMGGGSGSSGAGAP